MKAATIYDVARHAGVSHQTVTRFLRGFEGIRPETRARVESALAELRYRPNTAARSLRLATTHRLGAIADRIDEHGPARVLLGATRAAKRRGYLLDVLSIDPLDPSSAAEAIDVLRGDRVDGIFSTAQTDVVLDLLRRGVDGVPLVPDVSLLLTSDDAAANAATGAVAADHLLDLGHRRIGYVAGPDRWIAARSRSSGFTARVEERGGRVVWRADGDWSASSGHAAWRSDPPGADVTAVAAANDAMAIGLMSAAAEDGRSAPRDISVIGTDDVPEARYLLPGLTTVALDFEGEGEALIAALLAQMGVAAPPPPAPAPPRVIARGTTAPLA